MKTSNKPLKITIATDSFKGSLSSHQACRIIGMAFEDRLGDSNVTINQVPLSDGGEGLIEIVKGYIDNEIFTASVSNALGKEVDVDYLVYQDKETKTAVLEMASVVGLSLLKDYEKNPMNTTTFGFGELILDALDRGVSNFIIGIGGTSTNDAGFGMLSALGVLFFDFYGNQLTGNTPLSMLDLSKIDISNLDERAANANFVIACDVNNTFCGEFGASKVFAPQKGADNNCVEALDEILKKFALIIKKDLGKDIINEPRSGAAGGAGGSFLAFFDARLESGIEAVMNITSFSKEILDSDLVITGEGRTDKQTLDGKAVLGVIKMAKHYKKKVIVISGSLGDGYEHLLALGADKVVGADSFGDTGHNFEKAAEVLYSAAYSISGSL